MLNTGPSIVAFIENGKTNTVPILRVCGGALLGLGNWT